MPVLMTPDHAYVETDTGQEFPSVTTVIKSAGFMGELNADPFYVQRGSMVHKATEMFDLGVLDFDSLDPRIAPYVTAWVKYRRDFPEPFSFIERSFVHPTLCYAGTLDRPLLDIKTGISSAWHIIQAAAYARLSGKHCSTWRTVYLRGDGTYYLKRFTVADLFDGWKVFQAALVVQTWKQEKKIA